MNKDYQKLVARAKKSRKGRKKLRGLLLVGALAVLILVPTVYKLIEIYEDTFLVKSKIEVDTIDFDKKSVINPKYVGVDNKNQPFFMTADTATQQKENMVQLENVKGEIKLTDGDTVNVRANKGFVNTENDKKADLYGAVHVFHDKGYDAKTEVAHIDFADSTISGPQKIKAKSNQGTARGDRFMLDYGKKIITLYGKPHLIIVSN